MVGIIVVAHGKLADGFRSAAELIIGEQKNFQSIGLFESDSIDDLPKKIDASIKGFENVDGVLIFVDLFGASPFNASVKTAHYSEKIPVDVIAGVNLGMLLEVMMLRETQSLEELSKIALKSGTEAIKSFADLI